MLQSARKHMRSIAMLGVAAALVVGGVAAAQGDSQGGSQSSGQSAGGRPPGPPPMMGIAMKGLTYAELHVQNTSGEAETLRIDQRDPDSAPVGRTDAAASGRKARAEFPGEPRQLVAAEEIRSYPALSCL